MNIPGLLIEYLITGSIAFIWIIPLFSIFEISLTTHISSLGSIVSLVGIPFIYVFGLSLDMISLFIINKLKLKEKIREKIREKIKPKFNKKYDIEKYDIQKYKEIFKINVWLYSSEIGKAYETRSSRDRIARGTVLNFIIAAFITPISICRTHGTILKLESLITFIIFILLSTLFYLIWKECEAITYEYQLHVLQLMLEEEQRKTKKM